MNYTHTANRIFVEQDGQLLAEITFPLTADNEYTIDHTFVDDRLRGQGIAGELVRLAVEQIKNQGGHVRATCTYAQAWVQRHPEAL